MGVAAANSQTICEEVAELLGISPDDVDPDTDLISQGLDSIRMMSLAGRWRRQGIDIDFASLAAEPSVRAWSSLVSSATIAERPAEPLATQNDSAAPFPLAPMQHAMWVGREGDQQLGGVAGHLYVEFDGDGVDPHASRGRRPRWPTATRCCGWSSCPTAPSASAPLPTIPGRSRGSPRPCARRGRAAARRHPADQIAPATRRSGLRAHAVVAARRKVPPSRRPRHAGRRRDELPHPDVRPGRRSTTASSCAPSATPIATTGWRRRPAGPSSPTGSGGQNAYRSCPIRRACRWFRPPNRPTRTTPPAAGTGWTRTPATRCSRRPGDVA